MKPAAAQYAIYSCRSETVKGATKPEQGRRSAQPAANKVHKPLEVVLGKDEDMEAAVAQLVFLPEFNAGVVAHAFTTNTVGDDAAGITKLVETLKDTNKRVRDGDLSTPEAMLLSQAIALQAIFTSYARRAQSQQYQHHLEAFMGLALRAQAQSRATVQALVELKYPRQATFVRQANIANGPQQVNNGPHTPTAIPHPSRARAEQIPDAQNELLEDQHERMDTGASGTAGAGRPQLEAMAAINRPRDRRRKSAGKP